MPMPIPILIQNSIHHNDDEILGGGDSKGRHSDDENYDENHEDFHDANDGNTQDTDDHFIDQNITQRRKKTPSYFEPTILDGPRIRKPSRKAQESQAQDSHDSQQGFNSTIVHRDYPSFFTANDIP
jgi:hypothetical protein